ncbi:hypothetical protein PPYR_01488 [Photinus pyralis]|uniref:DDE Tnp4 domain-containing protein n=1 Tax=Photinus pyralis TaxID=7054 RepID=A0A5N4B4Q8_PHOPY|nr:hypothetical protein PPYR_01488 [Photinus pyralis]
MNEIFDIFEELMSDDEEIINFVERPRRRKQFRQRKNHFEEWDDEAFLDRFRLSKDCILAILEQIEEQISYLTDRNEAVDALTQLLLTLRFYASGSMIIVAGDFGDYFLVGDSGYPVENYLMTPLLNPNTPAQHLYNEAQIRTRNVVERSYGVWKRRFAVLSLGLRVKLTTTLNIIVATAVLHNIAINMKVINPPPVEVNIENVEWDVAVYEERHGRDNVRTNLIDNYFSHLL